ncbi:MAG: protease modulator HflC [Planctomycetes bacterium]|nr:protease modulator HflC [Planctomycetota bacterium]
MNPQIRKLLIAIATGVVLLIGLIVVASAAFTVDESEQVVVLQFGKVKRVVSEPGLHFRNPIFDDLARFDRRSLEWDGEPNQIPTKGREFIKVDTTARWRITDPLKFLTSVRDEVGARARLDDILDSVVRDRVSATDLVEIVRSASWDPSKVASNRLVSDDTQLDKTIDSGREQLQADILAEARKSMPQYGIELVDFRVKRLNYIPSVQQQVFDRMISERQRVAEQFRAEGEGEASRIRGDTSRELAEITSVAQREAEEIRGRADAEAARIYNEAYGADPEFYAFVRTLQSYRDSIGEGTVMLLGADSAYFKYLNSGAKR